MININEAIRLAKEMVDKEIQDVGSICRFHCPLKYQYNLLDVADWTIAEMTYKTDLYISEKKHQVIAGGLVSILVDYCESKYRKSTFVNIFGDDYTFYSVKVLKKGEVMDYIN